MDNSNQNPNPFLTTPPPMTPPVAPTPDPTSFNPPIAPVASPFLQTPPTPPPLPLPEQTYNPMIPTAQDTQPIPPPAENAPTDLSHLIDPTMNVNSSPPAYAPQVSSQPETLVVPSGEPDVSVASTETGSKVPVWIMAIGGILLLVVAGASAYFILGLGKTAPVTSLPATVLVPPPPPTPIATPALAPTVPESTSSGTSTSFGQLNPTSSGTPRSAADLLKSKTK